MTPVLLLTDFLSLSSTSQEIRGETPGFTDAAPFRCIDNFLSDSRISKEKHLTGGKEKEKQKR